MCVYKGFLVCFWGLPLVLFQHSIWCDAFDARLLKMLNLVTNAKKKKKSVENLNKYANIVTVINSWQALFNE